MPRVSVIVPVYNVEKYLHRCVDSILAQTFTDFELILVDDGSMDYSGMICDEYAKKDRRVHVIHQSNKGVACARNTALDQVKGEYIAFCDSDDSWEPFLLSVVYQEAKKHHADCVPFNYTMIKEDRIIKEPNFWPGQFNLEDDNERINYIINVLLKYKQGYEVWDRLFRKEIIENNNIRFCTKCGNFGEDLGFTLKYMCYAKRVYCSNQRCYNYFVNEGSIMDQSKSKIRLNDLNEVCYDIMPTYYSVFQNPCLSKQFSIVHFLIMSQQYSKMINTSQYCTLSDELSKIEKNKWYQKNVRGLYKCYKELKRYFGEKTAKQILLFSNYCLHRNWKRFTIESAIFYKWIVRSE